MIYDAPIRSQRQAPPICRTMASRIWSPGRPSGPAAHMMLSEAGAFIAESNTARGGKLPLYTNGGGLSYMHSGMYGMYALQESVRQIRGIAPRRHRSNVSDDAPCVRGTGLSALRVEMRLVKRTLARSGTAPRLSLRGNVPASDRLQSAQP